MKVLYVAGLWHSGSTILANVLGELDGFFAAGELFYLREAWERGYPCGCGKPVPECELWSRVPVEGLRTDHAWRRVRSLPRLRLSSEAVAEHRRAFRDVVRALDGRVVVDSSKFVPYGQVVAGTPEVELYVVHLVRDPRANGYSWTRIPGYRVGPVGFGLAWNACHLAAEALWVRRPDRYLRVRYEDFVARPSETVLDIAAFVGEPAEELPFESSDTVRLHANHQVQGNPSRFRTGAVRLALDTRWETGLSRRWKLALEASTWPLRRRYGYR